MQSGVVDTLNPDMIDLIVLAVKASRCILLCTRVVDVGTSLDGLARELMGRRYP